MSIYTKEVTLGNLTNMDAKGRTNHYLFYAQTLIKEISSPNKDLGSPFSQAIEVSACLQLRQCWCAWLSELESLLKIDLDASDFLGQGKSAFSDNQNTSLPPELQYVQERCDQPNSWVTVLKALYNDPLAWLVEQRQRSQDLSGMKDPLSISVIDLNAEAIEPIDEVLLKVCNELKDYVHSVREQQTEW